MQNVIMSDAGYDITQGVLSSDECNALLRSLNNSGMHRRRAGARHLMSTPAVAALASDARLLHLAGKALNGRAVPFRATLFEKSGRANWLVMWHQDTALPLVGHVISAEWGPWSIKAGVLYAHAPTWALKRIVALRVHLDASTDDNGPLRVIPGSHRAGVLSDEEILHLAGKQRGVSCLVDRGGVMTMSPLLIHASSKGSVDELRRVIHIEFADSLDLGPSHRLAIA